MTTFATGVRPGELMRAAGLMVLFAEKTSGIPGPYHNLGSLKNRSLTRSQSTIAYKDDQADGTLATIREDIAEATISLSFTAHQWNAQTLKHFLLGGPVSRHDDGEALMDAVVARLDGRVPFRLPGGLSPLRAQPVSAVRSLDLTTTHVPAAAHAVTGADSALAEITIAGDQTAALTGGTVFEVVGGPNAGTYTVGTASVSGSDTVVEVVETVAADGAGGTLYIGGDWRPDTAANGVVRTIGSTIDDGAQVAVSYWRPQRAGFSFLPQQKSQVDGAARLIIAPADGPTVHWPFPNVTLRPAAGETTLNADDDWTGLSFEMVLSPPYADFSMEGVG